MRRLIVLLTTCYAQLAWAGHPRVTEDLDLQGEGGQQIELNTDRQRNRASSEQVAAFTYTYGLRDDVDIVVDIPLRLSSPSSTGAGDLEIGTKWVVYDSGDNRAGFSAATTLPTADEGRGLGNGRPNATLNLVFSHSAEPWKLLGNIAIASNHFHLEENREASRRLLWRVSGAVVYALNEYWSLTADAGLRRSPDIKNQHAPVFLVLGGAYSPNSKLDIDAGITFHRRCGSCEENGRTQWGIGLTRRF